MKSHTEGKSKQYTHRDCWCFYFSDHLFPSNTSKNNNQPSAAPVFPLMMAHQHPDLTLLPAREQCNQYLQDGSSVSWIPDICISSFPGTAWLLSGSFDVMWWVSKEIPNRSHLTKQTFLRYLDQKGRRNVDSQVENLWSRHWLFYYLSSLL